MIIKEFKLDDRGHYDHGRHYRINAAGVRVDVTQPGNSTKFVNANAIIFTREEKIALLLSSQNRWKLDEIVALLVKPLLLEDKERPPYMATVGLTIDTEETGKGPTTRDFLVSVVKSNLFDEFMIHIS